MGYDVFKDRKNNHIHLPIITHAYVLLNPVYIKSESIILNHIKSY
jgi:hypothetical protein